MRTAILEQVTACGARSVTALLERVLHDVDCGQRVVASVVGERVELFGDPELFRALRLHAIPWLRTCPFVNVWMCEPATPGEVYSLAILLCEAGIYPRTRIYATHRDGRRLAWCGEATLSARSLEASAPRYRLAGGSAALPGYFEQDGARLLPARALRQSILWAHYDPCHGAAFHEFNLIVCHACAPVAQAAGSRKALHALLADSQALSGLLLHPSQPLDPAIAGRYRLLDGGCGLYQRVR